MKIALYRRVQLLGILSIALSWIMGIPGMACAYIAILLAKNKKLPDPEQWTEKHTGILKSGVLYARIGFIVSAVFFILFSLAKIFNIYSIWDWKNGVN